MFREVVKSTAHKLLGFPGTARLRIARIKRAGLLTILSLHRVAPADGSTYPPLSPELFNELLGFCGKNFDVRTFGSLAEWTPGSKPPLILSFDDGYKDFVDYGLPLLRKHRLSCNHNFIPSAVESGNPPYDILLADYCGRAGDKDLAALAIEGMPRWSFGQGRDAYGSGLYMRLKARPMAEQHRIMAPALSHIFNDRGFEPTPTMNLAEVRQASSEVEVGAHSFEHATMSAESDEYVASDAVRCRRWFEKHLGSAPAIYAFPSGACREAQVDIVRDAGFPTILLVGDDFSTPRDTVHKRFNVDASSPSELRFRATGTTRFV